MSTHTRAAARAAFLFPLAAFLAGCGGSSSGDGGSEGSPDTAVQGSMAEAPGGAPEIGQDQMAVMMELRMIEQTLGPIQEQAMQDPELQEQQQRLVERVEAEMERIDPGAADERARFDSLRAEFGAAQQAGDQERVQALGAELQSLQTSIEETQRTVLEQEEIAAAVEAFRESLAEGMRATDPRADSLLDRHEELSEQWRATTEDTSGDG